MFLDLAIFLHLKLSFAPVVDSWAGCSSPILACLKGLDSLRFKGPNLVRQQNLKPRPAQQVAKKYGRATWMKDVGV